MSEIDVCGNHRDIAVLGNYGRGNFGDDLLTDYVLSLVCQIVSPGRVLVSAPEGSYVEKWFPGIQCTPAQRILQSTYHEVRKVVFGGGGQFFAFPPATIKNRWGLRNSTVYRYWHMCGQSGWRQLRTYAFCVGVGPLDGIGARWITRRLLSMLDEISVRDAVSKQILAKLGIRNVRVVTDPSIALATTLSPPPRRDPKTVGIVVRRWPRYPSVHGLIVALQSAAQSLRDLGWAVQFISFQSEYDMEVTRLLQSNGENVRGWSPESETIPEFCQYLSGFQVLMTMRAHGVFVSSLLGAIPVAVRIEPKLEIAATECGCQDYMIALGSSSADVVAAVERAGIASPVVCNWQDDLQALELESNRLRDWLQA